MTNQNDNAVLLECNKNDIEELPYDKCITCLMRNAKRCDGPNPLVFNSDRRVDFLRKLQQLNKETLRNGSTWSYDYISAQTDGVSKATVIRIMNEVNYDPGTYAYGEVFRVLFDSSVGTYPCGIHSEEKEVVYVDSPETLKEMERIQQENETIRAELAQLRSNIKCTHDFQEKELAAVREEARKQADAQAEAYRSDIKEYRELVAHMREQMARKDDYIDRLAKKAGI